MKKGTSKRKRASPKREKGVVKEMFRSPRNPVTKRSGSAPGLSTVEAVQYSGGLISVLWR